VFSSTGYHPLCRTFQVLRLTTTLSDSLLVRQNQPNAPQPHLRTLPAITRTWFGLFRFRSPLLTNRGCFLSVGTEMFHFPTFLHMPMCSGMGDRT